MRDLHAKLYVFGQARAIVTSANLTEHILEIHDGKLVRFDQYLESATLNAIISG